MAAVKFSTGARRDLRAIGDYIARDDPDRAESFVEELYSACVGLADYPRAYGSYPRYGPNARKRTYGNYHIVYRVDGDRVTILSIVHAARDI